MTNWEKYFGTPELAARSRFDTVFMLRQAGEFAEWLAKRWKVERRSIVNMNDESKAADYREWLEREADNDGSD